MNLRYFSGTQEIQKESILECCGSRPRIGEMPNAARMEADFIVATAEERAKQNIGTAIPFTVAGTVYKVLCK